MTTSAWAAIAGLLAVILVVIKVLRRSRQRLRLRIEAVSDERIDPTPTERNEIVSPVRVRPRVTPTVSVTEPAVETPEMAVEEPEVIHVDPQPEPTRSLVQEDLFPDTPNDPSSSQPLVSPSYEQVIAIHVMPRRHDMAGSDLLSKLIQFGFRFGEMQIFHRHEHPSGRGDVLFSLAQAQEPGTFDLDNMHQMSVTGVTLFMGLPRSKGLIAFDLLVATARRLCQEFEADMLDERGMVISAQRIADWRDEVLLLEDSPSLT